MSSEETVSQDVSAAQAMGVLAASLHDCAKCGLSGSRTQVVFGAGDPEADLMFVGEGPGFHEDRQGVPFVGQAGKLLTELLAGIGLARADVYIANVVKCRPPENRDPTPAEIEACSPHLMEQIAIIRPRVICTLGRFATKLLADTELSMTAIHGKAKERTLRGVRTLIFPVFHPAAALYTPANREVLEEDFAKLRTLLLRGVAALEPTEEGGTEVEAAAGPGSGLPPDTDGPAQASVPPAESGQSTAGPLSLDEASCVASVSTDRPSPDPAKPASAHPEQLPLW